uniref:Uncharacterized protein n=1 Tax=Rhizophora mucronata TaxID=61149 RepID=A0A2P2PWI9_RHIMU
MSLLRPRQIVLGSKCRLFHGRGFWSDTSSIDLCPLHVAENK